jgi:hypothetical protein
MMNLFVPLSFAVAVTLLQFAEPNRLVFCWRTNPVEGEGHEITTVFVIVRLMLSEGGGAGAGGTLNRYAVPAFWARCVSSNIAPMITRSFPTAATLAPKPSPTAGVGLVIVFRSVPLVLNT